jgi:hypothetical protein
MIFVTHRLPVNETGHPVVTRQTLWKGLVAKANNALPFVTVGQSSLDEPHRVVLARLTGPVLGTITNEIETGDDGEPRLKFGFALVVPGVPGGSPLEREPAEHMIGDYLRTVESTLSEIREVSANSSST